MASIKRIILKQKIQGVVYDLYPKTEAALVKYNESSSVSEALTNLTTELENISKDDGTIDSKIKAESDALYNKIMGLTDAGTTINEAYDTLKEVSDYLTAHEDVVSGFTSDISKLKTDLAALTTRVTNVESDVNTLKATVGDDSSGLVKQVNDNKTAIANLKAKSTNVKDSTINGNIIVDGAEITVYDDSAIAASKIVQDATHRFVTDTEKTTWNAHANIIVSSTVPDDLSENDLLLYELK